MKSTKPKQVYGYHDNKAQTLNRLARAEGQIRGVTKMVQGDKYCIDILTQIAAVQKALDGVAMELLGSHVKHCIQQSNTIDEKSEELMGAVRRLVKAG